jgi:hypothetical protein
MANDIAIGGCSTIILAVQTKVTKSEAKAASIRPLCGKTQNNTRASADFSYDSLIYAQQ